MTLCEEAQRRYELELYDFNEEAIERRKMDQARGYTFDVLFLPPQKTYFLCKNKECNCRAD